MLKRILPHGSRRRKVVSNIYRFFNPIRPPRRLMKSTKRAYEEYIQQILSIPAQGENGPDYVPFRGRKYERTTDDNKIIAFYLPQFYTFPENDRWWGKGFTEWTNVTKTPPFFVGHDQPRLAGELGYYNLNSIETIKRQMELAQFYGIFGFCIYYYWFDGKVLMDAPLKLIKNNPELDLPFCLCWADENWTRSWDGLESDILIEQNFAPGFASRIISDMEQYIDDPRYIRVDGKPLIIIYRSNLIPDFKAMVDEWRAYYRRKNTELHILEVAFMGISGVHHHDKCCDGYIEFPPHSTRDMVIKDICHSLKIFNRHFQGHVYDYNQIVAEKIYMEDTPFKYHKGIFLGWDNSARKRDRSTVFHNFSLSAFKEWLTDISHYTKEKFESAERLLFVNAWNEWAEGTYLEPDRRYGYGYLDTVRSVLRETSNPAKKIIFVSHDAWTHGAQMLSLNIIKALNQIFKYDVYVVLRDGAGELRDEFKKYSADLFSVSENSEGFSKWLDRTGAKIAICNTVVTGDILKTIAEKGIRCLSLIHEMEKVIREYSCEERLHFISKFADKIIFPSSYVLNSANTIEPMPVEKTEIIPQGFFLFNPYFDDRQTVREEIRKRYKLAANTKIGLGVGYGHFRKGVDLFIKSARLVCEKNPESAFIWVGLLDAGLEQQFRSLVPAHLTNRIIFAGQRQDLNKYYTAADLFMLTSREDPFPNVVLDAMHSSLPVVAFEDGGGYLDLVTPEVGGLSPMEDFADMANQVHKYLNDDNLCFKAGQAAHDKVSSKFNFIDYVSQLLHLLGRDYKKISVIIPNYNYAHYLPQRIESVLNQSYPLYEVIILDDKSTDDSLKVIKKYQHEQPLLIKVMANDFNSGSVCHQWELGIKHVSGDYVWIAEADDLSEDNFLETVMEKMHEDPQITLTFSQSKIIDAQGTVISDNYGFYTDSADKMHWRHDYINDAQEEIIQYMSILNSIPTVSAVVFKNENLESMLPLSKNYKTAGDWMFYVNYLSKGGKIAFVSDSLNKHRRHDKSVVSSSSSQQIFDNVCQMQDYIAEKFNNGVLIAAAKAYREKIKKYLGL